MITLSVRTVEVADPAATVRLLLEPVAVRIRRQRRLHNLTWSAVARGAGMRPGTLRRIESGTQGLTPAAVGRIARALGIDEEELYPGGRPGAFWEHLGSEMKRRYRRRPVSTLAIAA